MREDSLTWIDSFIRHLSHERRLSEHTCKNYRRDLDRLAAWCDEHKVPAWTELDDEHVRTYAATCFRRGLSPRSIQRQLSAARTFFCFLQREKKVSVNPAQSVSAPKSGKR